MHTSIEGTKREGQSACCFLNRGAAEQYCLTDKCSEAMYLIENSEEKLLKVFLATIQHLELNGKDMQFLPIL